MADDGDDPGETTDNAGSDDADDAPDSGDGDGVADRRDDAPDSDGGPDPDRGDDPEERDGTSDSDRTDDASDSGGGGDPDDASDGDGASDPDGGDGGDDLPDDFGLDGETAADVLPDADSAATGEDAVVSAESDGDDANSEESGEADDEGSDDDSAFSGNTIGGETSYPAETGGGEAAASDGGAYDGDYKDPYPGPDTSAGRGAYEADEVDYYSGSGTTGSGPTPGAPDDEEMPLADHIEEMVRRLAVVIVVGGLVAAVVFPFGERLINFLWYSFLPGSTEVCPVPIGQTDDAACPYIYHPLALMFARLKVASLAGFVLALPVLVYESYLFMKPGLYPQERRYYLASVPTSLVLAVVGVAFAYLLVLPTLFVYFTGYTSQAANVAFGLTETFNLIVMMMGFFALVFQIPLLIMLAVMMGVTSRRWLADRRLYFYGGFFTVAFVFSPDPTGMAPILVGVTMIVLFEGTLLVLRWTRESSPVPSSTELAARRPFVWLLALLVGYLASTAPLPPTYYGQLPAVVTDAIASVGLTRVTSLVVGGALIAVYELAAYAARRANVDVRVRRGLTRGRALAWPLFLVVGYFGSPDPALLARVEALALAPTRAGLLVVGLVVGFELFVAALDWRERRGESP